MYIGIRVYVFLQKNFEITLAAFYLGYGFISR